MEMRPRRLLAPGEGFRNEYQALSRGWQLPHLPDLSDTGLRSSVVTLQAQESTKMKAVIAFFFFFLRKQTGKSVKYSSVPNSFDGAYSDGSRVRFKSGSSQLPSLTWFTLENIGPFTTCLKKTHRHHKLTEPDFQLRHAPHGYRQRHRGICVPAAVGPLRRGAPGPS